MSSERGYMGEPSASQLIQESIAELERERWENREWADSNRPITTQEILQRAEQNKNPYPC